MIQQEVSNDYHKRIIQYYKDTENAYKDSWDLDNSLAIHYGYWDEKVKSFSQSLLRMNEVMIEAAGITQNDRVLDAGCGVGGSAIFIGKTIGADVTGITLSERQMSHAIQNADKAGISQLTRFLQMDYCNYKSSSGFQKSICFFNKFIFAHSITNTFTTPQNIEAGIRETCVAIIHL